MARPMTQDEAQEWARDSRIAFERRTAFRMLINLGMESEVEKIELAGFRWEKDTLEDLIKRTEKSNGA